MSEEERLRREAERVAELEASKASARCVQSLTFTIHLSRSRVRAENRARGAARGGVGAGRRVVRRGGRHRVGPADAPGGAASGGVALHRPHAGKAASLALARLFGETLTHIAMRCACSRAPSRRKPPPRVPAADVAGWYPHAAHALARGGLWRAGEPCPLLRLDIATAAGVRGRQARHVHGVSGARLRSGQHCGTGCCPGPRRTAPALRRRGLQRGGASAQRRCAHRRGVCRCR
jgi:hypothetical protein